jgi:hypothetical protein
LRAQPRRRAALWHLKSEFGRILQLLGRREMELMIYRANAYAELVSNPDLCISYSEIMARLGARQVCFVNKPPIHGPWSTDMGMVFHPRTFYPILLFSHLYIIRSNSPTCMVLTNSQYRQRLESLPRIPRHVWHPHRKRSGKSHARFHGRGGHRRSSPVDDPD